MNDIFSFMLIIQFVGTIVDICTNVYKLSRVNIINAQTLVEIILLPSILVQIYMYSYYGNELKLKVSCIFFINDSNYLIIIIIIL